MGTDRGFTLIEVLIAVGIVALVAMGSVGAALSARSMAVNAAATEFDTLLDAARTSSHDFSNGVTVAFTPDAYGDGFVAQVYLNRPGTEALVPSTIPALNARVSLNETEALGAPAFAIALHASGAVGGIAGVVTAGSAGPEMPCPGSGAYHLIFSHAGAKAERYIACRTNLATSGTAATASSAPATAAPTPTTPSCVGLQCINTPTSPNPQASCPPHYFATNPTTCVNPPLVVNPTSLTFTTVGTPSYLTYSVHEDYYAGNFNVTDNCGSSIQDTNATGAGRGPTSTFAVVAKGANVDCQISVTDDRGSPTQTVNVRVGQTSLVALYICDPQAPPRPYGFDLGPDPDGIHEDYSNGQSCVIATPNPGPLRETIKSIEYTCQNSGDSGTVVTTSLTTAGDIVAGGFSHGVYSPYSPANLMAMQPNTPIELTTEVTYVQIFTNCI